MTWRVEQVYFDGPSFEPYEDSNNKVFRVFIRLDKAKRRMSNYWKFNSSLLDEKDFRNQLELILKWELLVDICGNSCWANNKDNFRTFAADYSRRLKLDMVPKRNC